MTPGRPSTSANQILNNLHKDGWTGHQELFQAVNLTYPAFRSVIFRLKREGKIEVDSDPWRGNGSIHVEGETTWYKLR